MFGYYVALSVAVPLQQQGKVMDNTRYDRDFVSALSLLRYADLVHPPVKSSDYVITSSSAQGSYSLVNS